jgi:hypothetical protein
VSASQRTSPPCADKDVALPSIADRLANIHTQAHPKNAAIQTEDDALDPPFQISDIHINPYLWFYRFGPVVLLSTASDARERARIQHGLGERRVTEIDMPAALSMGLSAKAAIVDAAAALSASHQNMAHLALDLGMYATAMAIGRRYHSRLTRLSMDLQNTEFDRFIERALHTSRMGACRELRQTASEIQHA